MWNPARIEAKHTSRGRSVVRNIVLYLRDILSAIHAIEKFVENMDIQGFKRDDKTSSAVIRKFEIIGEAAKHINAAVHVSYFRKRCYP